MASYLFKNVTWHDGQKKVTGDVRTNGGVIVETSKELQPKREEQTASFNNHFIYPGLINGHDHLEMNVYPKLGTPPYSNYIDWSNDIYKPKESPVCEIEKINIEDRLLWGGLKNLISGSTTVIHHNPWHTFFDNREFPVKVLKGMSWAHSIEFEKEIVKKYSKQPSVPFVIHAGEGIDKISFLEIPTLDDLGVLRNNTVLIHAIAIDDVSIARIEKNQASIVWCPASNLFMFNATAPIKKIYGKIKVAIGTDSTMTGASTLLDELHVAAKTNLATSEQLYQMATNQTAAIFRLNNPSIAPAMAADFFITPAKHNDYFENLMLVNPADILLVLVNGKLNLLDSEIDLQENLLKNHFSVQGRTKTAVVNISALKKRIEKKVALKVLGLNPLWNMVEV